MKRKRALITGISGQDGAYLAKFLINKNYEVIGGVKNINPKRLWRLKELNLLNRLKIINFNLINNKNVDQIIKNGQFNEIYNLGAQSSVNESFINPINAYNGNNAFDNKCNINIC